MSAAGQNVHSVRDVSASRANAPHTSMFLRMLVRAAILRRGRAASALIAMVVAAAVATAMLNLYVDVQSKLRREFRNYGANIIVVGKDGASLPANALAAVDSALAGRSIAAPFGLVVARTSDGQPIVVAGTDFDRVKQLNKWWSVSRWPSELPTSRVEETREMGHPALIGVRALPEVAPKNQPFDLTFQGRTLRVTPAGTVQTGAAEDSRIYISLADFIAWTGVQPSTIEIAASGSPEEVASIMSQVAQSTSGGRRASRAADHGRRSPRAGQDSRHAPGGLGTDYPDRRTLRALHFNGMGLRPAARLRHHESSGRIGTIAQRILCRRSCSARRKRRLDRIPDRHRHRRLDRPG